MPCSPNDVSLPEPTGSSGPAIPGFGIPSILKLPNIAPVPSGFPEDLLDIFNNLQMLIPPGALKPQLNPNFGKDIYDGIMKLLDQFQPFLMLYKFFLPVLNLIICIIEVLCSLMNPFALIRAIRRLFRTCIPEFLNIFPVFALIVMAISLLLLLISLIEYVVQQILKLVKALLLNITALQKAFQNSDDGGVLAIAKKIGSLLCMFQNFFVLLALFDTIINVIKNILKLAFSIPPCEDGDSGDEESCCTPETCPDIVKQPYTRITGIFKYLNLVGAQTNVQLPSGFLNVEVRPESWQFYDLNQELPEQFRNIFDAYDVLITPKPIFFPTDATYSAQTDPKQAPYLVDLKLLYNPFNWGRVGLTRYIIFKDCILTKVPTRNLNEGDNTVQTVNNGVIILAGGKGYEADGTTILTGFASDGITAISAQATLENFIHYAPVYSITPILSINDGYTFFDAEYTFKPNVNPLLQKNIITLGCVPEIAINRAFINNVFAADISLKTQLLNGVVFPDTAAAQQCLETAISALRTNLTPDGVAQFQATSDICLQTLKNETNAALSNLIGIGFDPCKSSFNLSPVIQFTTKPIQVSVQLNERNGLSLTNSLSTDIANDLASRIKAHITLGEIGKFTYDGYSLFVADLTSDKQGKGEIMISFDNNIFCTTNIPADNNIPPSQDLQVKEYQFIYAPGTVPTAEGDTEGAPRYDAGDLARDSING